MKTKENPLMFKTIYVCKVDKGVLINLKHDKMLSI